VTPYHQQIIGVSIQEPYTQKTGNNRLFFERGKGQRSRGKIRLKEKGKRGKVSIKKKA